MRQSRQKKVLPYYTDLDMLQQHQSVSHCCPEWRTARNSGLEPNTECN